MTERRYLVDRRVGATPETVLAMIRDTAETTRRPALPPPVRKGVRGLRGKVRGERFTVWFDENSEGDGTDLHGWVLPDGEGAAKVQASVQIERTTGTVVLVLLAFAAVVVLAGGRDGWIIAGFAVVVGIISAVRRAGGFMNHEQAAFLVQWLHEVLDRLPSAPPAPPDAHPATVDAA